MAVSYLADTSVLTRIALPTVRHAVESHAASGDVARCAMTNLELGFSARNAAEWDRIEHAASTFSHEDVEPNDFRRAGQVQRMLANAGLKGRKVPDLLIASVAARTGRTLLHYDHDVEHIAKITGQAQTWIVPPGTIDR